MAKTLAQMLIDQQKARGMTDRAASTEIGVLQQTYSNWKAGTIPRENAHAGIAKFLGIPIGDIDGLIDEAGASSNETPLSAYSSARVYGRVADRKDGKFKFDTSRKAVPEGRYAVVVDTKVMEPAFRVGCKVWLDPGVWPRVGDDVIVHTKGGVAWIGQLAELGEVVRLRRYAGPEAVVGNVAAVHVIVLAERV